MDLVWTGIGNERFWTVLASSLLYKEQHIAQDKEAGPNLKPLEHITTLEGERRVLKDGVQMDLITTKLVIIHTLNQREI